MVLLGKTNVFEDRPLGARVPPSSILEVKNKAKIDPKLYQTTYKNQGLQPRSAFWLTFSPPKSDLDFDWFVDRFVNQF